MAAKSGTSVADMVSKFSSKQEQTTNMSPGVKIGSLKHQNSTPIQKGSGDQVSPNTSPFHKVILVSESGNVIDEKDPRCLRTLDHFKPGRVQTRKPNPVVIKSMGFNGYQYNTHLSTQTGKTQTLPMRKSVSTSSLNNSTSSTVEKHYGGVYYRRKVSPSKNLPDTVNNSLSSSVSPSIRSVPSSPSPVVKLTAVRQPGGTWYHKSNDKVENDKRSFERSNSFTSRVSCQIRNTPKQENTQRKRSSITFDIEDGDIIASQISVSTDGQSSPKPEKCLPSTLNSEIYPISTSKKPETSSPKLGKSSPLPVPKDEKFPLSPKPEKTSISSPKPEKKIPSSQKSTKQSLSSPKPEICKILSTKHGNCPSPKTEECPVSIPQPEKTLTSFQKPEKTLTSISKPEKTLTASPKFEKTLTSPKPEKSPPRPPPKPGKHSLSSSIPPVDSPPSLEKGKHPPSSSKLKSSLRSESISSGKHRKDNSSMSIQERIALFQNTTVNTTKPPISTPISTPKSTSISPPTSTPISTSKSTPVSPPISTPTSTPISTSKSTPISPPISSPMSTPTSTPISTSKSTPISPPISSPMSSPISAPISTPIFAPISLNAKMSKSEDVYSSSDDEEQEIMKQNRLRSISSLKDDDDKDMSIEIDVFDENIGANEINHEYDDNVFTRTNTETTDHFAIQERSETQDIKDGDTNEISDQSSILSSSPIYSYQEYTLKRKQSRGSSSNQSSDPSKPLEPIPEIPSHSPNPPSEGRTSAEPHDTGGSSSDSEHELVKRMSLISTSFCEELLAKVNETISSQSGLSVSEHITQVFDEMVRNAPTEIDENVYEDIEEYSRKISDYYLNCNKKNEGDDEDETPPELPPRPDFLVKLLNQEESEKPSILTDSYIEMNPAIQRVPEVNSDDDDYELMTLNISNKSPKKRSPKRSIKKKSPIREPFHYDNEPESSPIRQRAVSQSDDKRQYVKKKRKYSTLFGGRRSKIEPRDAISMTLPHKLSHEPNMLDDDYYPVQDNGHTHYTYKQDPEYINVGVHDNTIKPINTSESEADEDDNDTDSHSTNYTTGSQSPTKIRMKDVGLLHHDLPYTITPDSGIFTNGGNKRFTRNPMTPPLVTKLSVAGSNLPLVEGIRFSSSDPSLHLSLLSSSIPHSNPMQVPASPSLSFSQITNESDEESTVSSSESGKYSEQLLKSPSSTQIKKVQNNFPHERSTTSAGAVQKVQLLASRKRRGSITGSTEACPLINSVCMYIAFVVMAIAGYVY